MSILRVQKTERYSIIANDCFADSRLSYRAVGLLCYLLSKPNDWQVRTEELTNAHREGRDATLATLKELRSCGYITLEKGFGGVDYTVRERPLDADYQEPENQGTDNQGAGKPTLLRTELDQGLKKPKTEENARAKSAETQGNATPIQQAKRPTTQSDSGSRREPKQPQVSAPPAPNELLRFITVYPSHRTGCNTIDLQAAWARAKSEATTEQLFAALEKYKASWKWTNEPKYVPGIVKWLAEKRWKIEPPPAPYEAPPTPGHLHPKEGQNTMIWGVDY